MKKVLVYTFLASSIAFSLVRLSFAGPQSTTYELEEYGFGSGGTEGIGTTSPSYTMFGTAGEVDNGKIDSASCT